MTLSRTNTVLAVLLAVVVVMTAGSRIDYAQPNLEVLPDMKYSPAWTAFEPNPNFPNGRTLQEPVSGTVARGELPLHYEATKEDAVRAGEELINPYDYRGRNGDRQETEEQVAARLRRESSVSRGGEIYRTFCVSCHGAQGAGDGPVAQRGFPPPPSLLTGKSPNMKDGQLFHILTYGQGSMKRFAAQLSRDDRWDVVNFVRELQSTTLLEIGGTRQ